MALEPRKTIPEAEAGDDNHQDRNEHYLRPGHGVGVENLDGAKQGEQAACRGVAGACICVAGTSGHQPQERGRVVEQSFIAVRDAHQDDGRAKGDL